MSEYPLISCICPTRDRPKFLAQSLHYFQAQDYPNTELLVIDDSDDPTLTAEYPNVRQIYISEKLTIGMKRNIACSVAKGEIIALWDDDDWYSPCRMSQQVQPLLAGSADATGLTMGIVFNIPTWQAWKCSPVLHKEIWAHDMVAGTLMFRKSFWNALSTYPSKSIGEDADFLAMLSQHGARLTQVQNDGSFIYIRHDEQNIWPLPPHHTYPHVHEWQHLPIEQYLSASDQAFYRQFQAVQA